MYVSRVLNRKGGWGGGKKVEATIHARLEKARLLSSRSYRKSHLQARSTSLYHGYESLCA